MLTKIQNQSSRESIIFSANGTRVIAKKIFSSYIMPYTKMDSKWITDLNIKSKYIQLWEENIFVTLIIWTLSKFKISALWKILFRQRHVWHQDPLHWLMTPYPGADQSVESTTLKKHTRKADKYAIGIVSKVFWEKIFAKHISDRVFWSRLHKEHSKLISKRNNSIFKMGKTFEKALDQISYMDIK